MIGREKKREHSRKNIYVRREAYVYPETKCKDNH